MSIQIETLRSRVREKLGDVSVETNKQAIPTYRLDAAIVSNTKLLAGRLSQPLVWDTSWLTLVAGTSEYTITKTYDTHTVALFKHRASGLLIEKVSAEMFESIRQGVTGSGLAPTVLTILEGAGSSGAVRLLVVRVFPTPNASGNIDALRSDFPNDPTTSEDIPLSELGATALEYMIASELAATMSPDKAALIGLDKSVASLWFERAKQAEYDEFVRVARLRRGRQLNGSMVM